MRSSPSNDNDASHHDQHQEDYLLALRLQQEEEEMSQRPQRERGQSSLSSQNRRGGASASLSDEKAGYRGNHNSESNPAQQAPQHHQQLERRSHAILSLTGERVEQQMRQEKDGKSSGTSTLAGAMAEENPVATKTKKKKKLKKKKKSAKRSKKEKRNKKSSTTTNTSSKRQRSLPPGTVIGAVSVPGNRRPNHDDDDDSSRSSESSDEEDPEQPPLQRQPRHAAPGAFRIGAALTRRNRRAEQEDSGESSSSDDEEEDSDTPNPTTEYYRDDGYDEEAGHDGQSAHDHHDSKEDSGRRDFLIGVIVLVVVVVAMVGVIVGVVVSGGSDGGGSSEPTLDLVPGTQACDDDPVCKLHPDHIWPHPDPGTAACEADPICSTRSDHIELWSTSSENDQAEGFGDWVELYSDSFEEDTGIWSVAEQHAFIEDEAAWASRNSTRCLSLEFGNNFQNSAQSISDAEQMSSSSYTEPIPFSTWDQLRVTFDFKSNKYLEGDSFFLESAFQDSSNDLFRADWEVQKEYKLGVDWTEGGSREEHLNNQVAFAIAPNIDRSTVYYFLRFRGFSSHLPGNIKIDNVVIEGRSRENTDIFEDKPWTTLSSDSFEEDTGSWIVAEQHTALEERDVWASGDGTVSVRIRYGNNFATSTSDRETISQEEMSSSIYTNLIQVSAFEQLRVTFDFKSDSYVQGDSFFLESTFGNSTEKLFTARWDVQLEYTFGVEWSSQGPTEEHSGNEAVISISSDMDRSSEYYILRFRSFSVVEEGKTTTFTLRRDDRTCRINIKNQKNDRPSWWLYEREEEQYSANYNMVGLVPFTVVVLY